MIGVVGTVPGMAFARVLLIVMTVGMTIAIVDVREAAESAERAYLRHVDTVFECSDTALVDTHYPDFPSVVGMPRGHRTVFQEPLGLWRGCVFRRCSRC
jgi:hypothetical protein